MTGFDSKRQMARDKVVEPTQEPVAWQWLGSAHFRKKLPKNADKTAWNPLYTTPQQRPWVGLTDEELTLCESEEDVRFVRAIEAVLRSKNT